MSPEIEADLMKTPVLVGGYARAVRKAIPFNPFSVKTTLKFPDRPQAGIPHSFIQRGNVLFENLVRSGF